MTYRVMKIFATTPLSPSVRVPSKSGRKVSSIASSTHRADDGNIQENDGQRNLELTIDTKDINKAEMSL